MRINENEQNLLECSDGNSSEASFYASMITTVKKNVFTENNQQIIYTVLIYALGDAIWSGLSYVNFGINLKPTNDTDFDTRSQWAGQELYSSLAMGFLGILIAAHYRFKKENTKAIDVMVVAAAGSLSLYTWDRAQTCGIEYFKKIGYSTNSAGYLSSIFTGLSEAATQLLFLKLARVVINTEEYNLFKNNPTVFWKRFLGETALNLTIGSIPGAVWQLVYNAAVIYKIGAIATGLAVATSVALSNTLAMKLIQNIMLSKSYSDCLGSIPMDKPDSDLHAPCIQCFNWMNSPKKTEAVTESENAPSLTAQIL